MAAARRRAARVGPDLWPSLPDELVEAVFSCLDCRSLARAACVSRRFRALAASEQFWARLLRARYPRGRAAPGGAARTHLRARVLAERLRRVRRRLERSPLPEDCARLLQAQFRVLVNGAEAVGAHVETLGEVVRGDCVLYALCDLAAAAVDDEALPLREVHELELQVRSRLLDSAFVRAFHTRYPTAAAPATCWRHVCDSEDDQVALAALDVAGLDVLAACWRKTAAGGSAPPSFLSRPVAALWLPVAFAQLQRLLLPRPTAEEEEEEAADAPDVDVHVVLRGSAPEPLWWHRFTVAAAPLVAAAPEPRVPLLREGELHHQFAGAPQAPHLEWRSGVLRGRFRGGALLLHMQVGYSRTRVLRVLLKVVLPRADREASVLYDATADSSNYFRLAAGRAVELACAFDASADRTTITEVALLQEPNA